MAIGKTLESSFYEPLHLNKNETYEEETSPTDSITIQGNNELEIKPDKLEGKTNSVSHDSFTEQASEMFHNFF